MPEPTSHSAAARTRRPLHRLLVAASVAAATLSFAGAASAQEPPGQAITAAIDVTPGSVTPPETATATATFEVGPIANVVGGRVVTLSLDIIGSDGSLQLDEASITTSAGLTGCAPASAAPVLSYSCQVAGPTSTTDTYTISATILSQNPDSGFPVVAQVSANSSYRDGTNTPIDGDIDTADLAVLLPGVEPPAGTSISATCVDDQLTVDITAGTTNPNFFINVGEQVDLQAPAVTPGSYSFPAGGASDIRARVFTLPDLSLVFDESVPCTVSPTTTTTTVAPSTTAPASTAPTTAAPTTTNDGGAVPELPATGDGAGRLAMLAVALTGLGALALTMARRDERTHS